MAKPYNQAAAGRILRNRPRTPEEVLPGEPSAAARRGAQAGVMADIPGGLVDLSRGALGYGAAGLESLLPPEVAEGLGVSGFRRYMLPYSEEEKRQARAQFGAAPFGSSERIEEELVRSGALSPTTGTREEMVARLLAGLADAAPGPVGAGTLTGRRLGKAAAETATAPVFYSPLLEAAATSQTQKASPEQWISTLKKQPGIKEAELEWTGVEDWLKSKDRPVTRQELEDYLQGTEIQVQEVVKGDGGLPWSFNQDTMQYDLTLPDGQIEHYKTVDQLQRGIVEARDFYGTTKFEKHTLSGGENYRELLLTVPSDNSKKVVRRKELAAIDRERPLSIEEQREYDTLQKEVKGTAGTFKSSHWDEPNVVAHVRFNDRTTPEGERVLFLEEIQSDWAQEGRKKGFIPTEEEKIKASNKIKELRKQQQELLLKYDETKDPVYNEQWQKIEDQIPALGRLAVVSDTGLTSRVPRAPFVQNTDQWTSLALKRVIRYAADKGYDRIAWTPGKVQTDRYGLSKHIKALHYAKRPDGTYDIKGIKQMGDRPRPLVEGVAEDKLADYVGDGVAKKIISGEGNEIKFTPYKSLSGLDLEVGGEGMKSFYDKIVPSIANKIGKKHGAKTEVTTVETAAGDLKALSIPMTEKLKSAAKQGLPYFVVLPPVMASSFRPEEQQRAVPPKAMPARRIVQQATK